MNCLICHSSDISKFNYGNIELLKCKNCDITYLEKFPDNDSLKSFYSDNYHISTHTSDIELRRSVQQIENYHILDLIKKHNFEAKSIVDIGCDTGFFIDEARRNCYEVYGIELNQEAVRYCNNIGLNVKNSIDEFKLKFDIAVMNHSLEHFANPKQFINNLSLYIADKGIVIIRVPAFDSFFSKLLKHKWIWFQPSNHYFHYSIRSIKYLLESCNFEVIYAEHRNPSKITHYFKYILSRLEFSKYHLIPFKFKILVSQLIKNITATEIIIVAKCKKSN